VIVKLLVDRGGWVVGRVVVTVLLRGASRHLSRGAARWS
jgi:hypothetical protein